MTVLICGDGIAGLASAFWLLKLNTDVTIIERAAAPRNSGQAIDIRGPAVEVIKRMGLEDTIRSYKTGETGIEKIDAFGNVCAVFDATGDTSRQSLVSEFEILRSDLCRALREPVQDRVKIVYGETVKSLDDDGTKVRVEFANGTLPDESNYADFESYTCFVTISRSASDPATRGRLYNATGRRVIFLRPIPSGEIAAYLVVVCTKDARFEQMLDQDVGAQKALFMDVFKDAGWETERILTAMKSADDFYMQKVAQVKRDTWTKGLVALMGDAGYAPSTGYGTSAAIYGAYVLAGEISNRPHDLRTAIQCYENTLRPWIQKVRRVPPGLPWIINPETSWGIAVLNYLAAAVYCSNLSKLIDYFITPKGEDESLPVYKSLQQ